MTTKEVIGNAKDLLTRVHFKMGNSISVRDTDELALSSAISLIQDYQKLGERVSVDNVISVLHKWDER